MPEGVPPPPAKPAFPPDDFIKEIEQSYVRKRQARMDALGIVTPAKAEQFVAADLRLFERKDVLTKVYPLTDHVIICEGDSWFNHPFLEDIPEQLLDFGYSVLHSNYPGKHLEASLTEEKFLAPLLDGRKPQIKALVLSGGGNDLINWHKGDAKFSPIFRKASSGSSPGDFIDAANLRLALQDLAGWLRGISDKLAQANAKELPVLLHCYDFISPKIYGPSPFKGTWVNPQLDAIGAPKDPAFRKGITGELQKPWIGAYKDACQRLGWHFVGTQNLVKNRWHDEIHPKDDAFYEISCVYWELLHELGILPSRRIAQLTAAA
jgi:hypothetical protein